MKNIKVYFTVLLMFVLLMISGCGTYSNGGEVASDEEQLPIEQIHEGGGEQPPIERVYEGDGEQLLIEQVYVEDVQEPSFLTDALLFVETVEITHPIFEFPDMLADDYEDIRRTFLESAEQAESEAEFGFAPQRYIRVLRDGHMSFDGVRFFGGLFADVDWDVKEGGLFLLDNTGTVGVEVLKIGGVYVSDIFNVIETYFYFENEAHLRKKLAGMSRSREIHERVGADVNNNILITLADGNEIIAYYQLPEQRHPSYIIRHEMLEDVFFISLRSFQFCQPAHNQTLEAIRNAISEGTRHFIIDLRGNGGGDSSVGLEILQAMGMRVPEFGIYRRMSPLAREQGQLIHRYINRDDGELWVNSLPNTAISHSWSNVVIAVLTDNVTYSSLR